MGLKIDKYFIETKLHSLIAIRDILLKFELQIPYFFVLKKCVNLTTRLLEKKKSKLHKKL